MDLARRPLGTSGLEITTRRVRRLGRRRRRLGLRLGAAGRRGLDRRDAARRRRAASTGSTPPPSTASAIRRRSSAASCAGLPAGDRPLVFTKCGAHLGRERPDGPSRRGPAARLDRAGVRGSLRRLGVERIDLYQFHWPDADGHAGRGLVGGDGPARRAGEGARGRRLATSTCALLERCEAVRHVDSLQPPFSLIRRGRRRARSPGAPPTATGVIATARCSRGS